MSSFGYPVTIRSTSVFVKILAFPTQLMNAGSRLQFAAVWRTVSFRRSPFLSISSQGSNIKTFGQITLKRDVAFQQKLLGLARKPPCPPFRTFPSPVHS